MPRPEVDLIGESERGRSHPPGGCLCDCPEQRVSTGVFDLEGQLVVAGGLMTCPIEGERAHMDGLTWLINGLFGRQQNGGFLFQLDVLRLAGLAERRIDGIEQIEGSGESGRETKLGGCRASGV